MKKVICIQCGTYVDYEVRESEQKAIIKKVEVTYKEKMAYCKDCGVAVWVEALEMENAFSPINAYCEAVGLISPQKIQEGLTKYNIGKGPLAKLLGWSEVTIVRFIDGQLPSKMYSDKLKDIFDDPKRFLELLEENKDNISNVAYNKAKKSAEDILKDQGDSISINVDAPIYQMITTPYSVFSKKDIRKIGARWENQICYC